MKEKKAGFISVDEYIASFPEDIQAKLQEMRAIVKAAAPEAKEKIGYQMPAYDLKGYLVYFAAWTKHIGFYPAGSDMKIFEDELAKYDSSKGTIKFPMDKPLPADLISKIVHFRVMENLQKAELKSKKKSK